MRERLQKVLSAAGIASRRGAEEMIARGEVRVNGKVASVGDAVDPDVDTVVIGGVRVGLSRRSRLYVAFHKPIGVVTSLRSTHGETTVVDLLQLDRRVFPVGRLDKETSGLLLLTDDGEWANLVTHPRHGVEKEYRAVVRGRPNEGELERMRKGIELPDGTRTAPADIRLFGERKGNGKLRITVVEGKKRQIRLMAAAVGHPALELMRVRVGPIELGDLPPGQWRKLEEREVEAVRQYARRTTVAGSN